MPDPNPPSTTADFLGARPLILLGCGKMGGALLEGWLSAGIPGPAISIVDPAPSDALEGRARECEIALNPDSLPAADCVVVLAVKPQIMESALPRVLPQARAGGLFLSIAAGVTLARLSRWLATERIVRAMPNTPAAIGRGITALAATQAVAESDRALAGALLDCVGRTVWLPGEELMDAVTAVSGSGPAYVFHLIEALAAAGESEGLAPDLALALARTTIAGAGALAEFSGTPPAALRENVTSPGGTTAAALTELMDETSGLEPLVRRAVRAAAQRSRELGSG